MMRSKDRGGRPGYDRYDDDYDSRRRGRSYSRSPRRLVIVASDVLIHY